MEHLGLSGAEAGELRSRPQFPTLLIADVAQEMSNDREGVEAAARDLYDEALAFHMSMSRRDPERAEFLAYRTVWNALATPICQAIDTEVARNILPRIQRGESLGQPEVTSTKFDEQFSRPYGKDELDILRTMATYTVAAARQFLREVSGDTTNWYFPLLNTFADYHPEFCRRERELTGKERPIDPVEAIVQFNFDANESVWGLMRSTLSHFPAWGEAWEQNKRRRLLSIIDQLARPAAVTAPVFDKWLNRYADGEQEKCPYTHEDPWTKQAGIWVLKLFQGDGSSKPPGYCPAISLTRSPFREDRQVVNAQIDQARRDAGLPPRQVFPYGVTTPVRQRLLLGTYVATEVRS